MDNQQDSIERLLSDLSSYSKEDFDNCIPYERADQLCSSRDELEDCLIAISEAAQRAGIHKGKTDAMYFSYLQDFLFRQGESLVPIDPPEEILEIDRLKKKLEEANKKPQYIIISPIKSPTTRDITDQDENKNLQIFSLGGRPISLFFGKYYANEETGAISVWQETDNNEVSICSHYVAPAAYVKHDNAGETISLVYYRDKEWHELRDVKKSILYEPGSVAKFLIDHGIDANQAMGSALADYFRTMEQCNRNRRIPVKRAISSLGWNENFSKFAPFDELYEFGSGKSNRRLYSGIYKPRGTYDNWKEAMRMIRDNEHMMARIILATSFASVLIRPFRGMRFVINIIGKSGIGKSVALRMAAGVWGDPNTLIASFDSTVYGALLRSNFLADIPLILDESETKKNKTDFDEFIYIMSGDYDRVKANSDEEVPTSTNCIFISGEHPLMKANSNLGAKNRVLDLKCDSFIFFDETNMERFVALLNENFGHAGRKFVSHLLDINDLQHAKDVYSKHMNSFPNRQGRIPAIILTADELIDEWIFQDGIRLTAEHLWPFLRTEKRVKEQIDYVKVHEAVEKWIIDEIKKNGKKETENGKVKEKRGNSPEAYVFRPGVLESIISDADGELYSYLEWAKQHNKLVTGKGRQYESQQIFINEKGKRRWFYTVCLPN